MSCSIRCDYKEINDSSNTNGLEKNENDKDNTCILLRQLLVCSALWSCYFVTGLCFGAPTVIVPQIRVEANSTDAISDETASWLSSTINYSGMILTAALAVLPRFMGRKANLFITLALSFIGVVILFFARTVTNLIIGMFFIGALMANLYIICPMIISEYSSPRYRGFFLTMKSSSFLWGIFVSNVIGTFFHWRYIFLLGGIANLYAILTIFKWPESPYWLAGKGRVEECTSAHRFIKGYSLESSKELELLLNRIMAKKQVKIETKGKHVGKFFKDVRDVKFFKPLFLAILIAALYSSLGKLVLSVYALDIIRKLTGSQRSAYWGMLILDGVSVVGMYTGCVISKFSKRRPFLFTTTGLGIFSLYALALYLYLVRLGLYNDNLYISVFFLTTYTLAVTCGPMILTTSLFTEIFPLSLRNMFSLLVAMFGHCTMATYLKTAPLVFSSCGVPGAFCFYASISLISTVLLYVYLPETKDKTLVEIETLFASNKREDIIRNESKL